MEFKESKTEKNLLAAFAGNQARNAGYFASAEKSRLKQSYLPGYGGK
jgi:hypothetical protein